MKHVGPTLAIALLLASCKHDDPKPAPRSDAGEHVLRVSPSLVDAGRVATARVQRKAPSGVVRLAADVIASPEGLAEAGSLVAGRLARFEAREGDTVKSGQILAWLDAPEAARAMADLLRARARAETAQKRVARLEPLVAQEAATQLALEDARLERDGARADLAAARIIVANLGLSEPGADAGAFSARVPVRSPVDGTIVERTAPLGAHVTPEAHLFRVVHEGGVLVEAKLPDGASVVLPPDAAAEIEQRGTTTCKARLVATLPEVTTATRTRPVRLLPEAGCKGLVAGAQAEARILVPGGTGDVLVVPANAVVEVKSTSVVFARSGDGFELRPVELGVRVGDDRVVKSGVTEADEVVTEGAVLLKGELLRSELE